MDYRKLALELLDKMTIEEKVGQLNLEAGFRIDGNGVPDSVDLVNRIRKGLVGTVIVPSNDCKKEILMMQKMAVEESRLHIPLLINSDMIHGHETVFPLPIAQAASFNTKLVEECARASSIEARAVGIHYTNAPMVDISRDPRWGRVIESEGEDPYLTSEISGAMVRGLQNKSTYVMATMKHYAGYGASEGGRDYNVVEVNENTMLNTYLVPFENGVINRCDSVMTGFNAIENIPISGNKKYLKQILREKFNFDGIIISDAGSIRELISYGVAKDEKEACIKAIEATVDIDLGGYIYCKELVNLVKEGKIKEELINESVLRILTKKYEMGLFENPYLKEELLDKLYSEEHLEKAYKLALECPVLLENNGILPLKKDNKVAIVGKFTSSKDVLGCWQYTHHTNETRTLFECMNDEYNVVGIKNDYLIEDIDKIIDNADVVIFNFGEGEEENGEAKSHHSLHLSDDIVNCFNYIKNKNKTIISIMYGGRPLILNEFTSSDALIVGWSLGHKTNEALVALISGKENFSGKLPITFIKDEGQIPLYYAKKKLGRPYDKNRPEWRFQCRYEDGFNEALYDFSYGISYSKFEYSNLIIDKKRFKNNDELKVKVTIKNNSNYDGYETALLFINDKVSEVLRPELELRGFNKVFIKANESKEVEFILDNRKFSYYHSDMKFYSDPGEFEIMVGGSINTLIKDEVILE